MEHGILLESRLSAISMNRPRNNSFRRKRKLDAAAYRVEVNRSFRVYLSFRVSLSLLAKREISNRNDWRPNFRTFPAVEVIKSRGLY